MKFRKWEIGGFDRDAAVELCRNDINPLVSVFLASRGITDIDSVHSFMGDTRSFAHDPLLMKDMEKAVSRINAAIDNNERIAIYGDYDVDGMTSSVLLSHWLRSHNADHEIYIPGRFGEGYGLNNAALDMLKQRGAGLVVTVDCGITAIEEARYARSIGLDLVITDHHECRNEIPAAEAVVDPKRPDCIYPNKTLAGVGVVFKLVCALENRRTLDDMLELYSDLVAIGTVADVMPVLGENRGLIKRGLDRLNTSPRPGLLQLLNKVGTVPGKVTAATIGFTLAPRLNAAGRMGQAELSVKLLQTDDADEAGVLSEELCRLNTERRNLEQIIYEEAVEMLPLPSPDGPIVLAKRGWYQGVTGIVAAKMAEQHRVPVIIISIDDDGVGRGSCRSFGSFAVYDALRSCGDILDNYGGHEMAAGVTVAEDNIEQLRKRIIRYYNDNSGDDPIPGLKLDFEVEKPELLTIQNIEELARLEPFGNGNHSPCLCIKNAVITFIQVIGSGKHTRLKIEKSGKSLDCIFFSAVPDEMGVDTGTTVDVAFEPQINEFRGRSSVQLQLTDIRVSQL